MPRHSCFCLDFLVFHFVRPHSRAAAS